MSEYTLAEGAYLYPTPAGSYYAISSAEENKSRRFLQRLLQQRETPALTLENLKIIYKEMMPSSAIGITKSDYLKYADYLQIIRDVLEKVILNKLH